MNTANEMAVALRLTSLVEASTFVKKLLAELRHKVFEKGENPWLPNTGHPLRFEVASADFGNCACLLLKKEGFEATLKITPSYPDGKMYEVLIPFPTLKKEEEKEEEEEEETEL